MPLDPLEDTLNALPAFGPAPAAPPPPAPISAFGTDPDRLSHAAGASATTPPDTAARILNLQLKTGLPAPVIERNLETVEKQAAQANFDAATFRKTSPLLASWLDQNRLHTPLAEPDLIPLTNMEATLGFAKDAVRGTGAGLYKGLDFGMWSALEAAGDVLHIPALAELGRYGNENASRVQKRVRGDVGPHGHVGEAVLSGFESLGSQAPIMAATILSGGATESARLGLTLMGTQTGGAAYSEARKAGRSPGTSLVFGAAQGVIEAWTEHLPLHTLLGDIAEKSGLVKTILHQAIPEIAGEEIATALQDLNEWAILHPDLPFSAYVKDRPQAFVDTAIATVVATGVQTGTFHALGKVAAGRAAQKTVTDLGAQAKEAGLTTRSPEKLAEFVAHAVQHTDAQTLYVPVEDWTNYWQGQKVDPSQMAEDLTGDREAYARAVESGEDLAIPTSTYAAKIAPTDANAVFAPAIRLGPDLMNAREAEAFMQQEMARATAAGEAAPTARDALRAMITQQLVDGGRFTPRDAEAQARLLEAGLGTMAEAAGENPQTVYQQYGVTIARPDLGTAAATVAVPVAPGAAATTDGAPAAGAEQDVEPPPVNGAEPDVTGEVTPEAPEAAAPEGAAAPDQESAAAPAVEPAAPTVPEPKAEPGLSAADAEMLRRRLKTLVNQYGAAPTSGTIARDIREIEARLLQHDALPEGYTLLDAGQKNLPSPDAAAIAGKPAEPRPRQNIQAEETADALKNLQATGVAYGPGGLKVRVVPTRQADRFELEITEKGQRRFEGMDLTLEEAQATGAQRLGELAVSPTKAPVTPQVDAPTGTAVVLPPFVTAGLSTTAEPAAPDTPAQPESALDTAPTDPQAESDVEPAAAELPEEPPAEHGVDVGAAPEAGDAGEPAERPGDVRAQDLAGEQPTTQEGVQPEPRQPKPDRKRGPRKRRVGVPAGAPDAGAGVKPGGSGGVHPASHVDTADVEPDADVAAAHARGEAPRHFVIDDTASLTEGGWGAKLDANLAAIRLLKALTAEGRLATDAEQAVLVRYIGWGHTNLKPIVDLREAEVRKRDPRLQKARADLESLLTAAELKELGESVANAHYSFADLPRAIWAGLERLGFTGGSILEPAVGTGHFLGTMPGHIVGHTATRIWAVEKEPIAAGIATHLYQDARVQNSPLQEATLPNDYFDVQVSNVPFGRIQIFDPAFTSPARRPMTTAVHNFYFGKALDAARPGGLVAFVTSRFTMDARSDTVRQYLANGFDLLGAVRLPDHAFSATAGTDVVTDILFLRKRLPGEAVGGHPWVQSVPHEALSKAADRPIHTNEYYQAHPEHVLGTQDLSGKMARTHDPQYNVAGSVSFEQVVAALTSALPERIYRPSDKAPRKLATPTTADVKQGSMQIEGGQVYFYDKATLVPAGLNKADTARAMHFVPLRDAYQLVLDTMVRNGTTEELEAAQAVLTASYEAYVAAHGYINTPENRRLIDRDPNGGRVLALENIEMTKGAKGRRATLTVLKERADIFTKRVVQPVVEATSVDTPADALTQSLAWKGAVDLAYMQGLTGKTEAQLTKALAGQMFKDPVTLTWVSRAEYLAGDVTTKLAQAEAAATTDASYTAQVAELQKVLPTPLTPEDFPAPFGATWVPVETVQQFVKEETGTTLDVKLTNTETRVEFYVEGYGGDHEFLPPGESLAKWVENALNGRLPTFYLSKADGGGQDVKRTETYRESLGQLRERWAEWWPANPDAADKLTKIYNAMFNREAPYVADGAHLVIPNANPEIKFRWWQKNVVWRALQQGNTLIAHAVGAGKTYAMNAIAGEWKRLGLAHKPMMVVPNHLIEQATRSYLRLYPGARILVPSESDFSARNRKRLVARVANNDWDIVIVPASHFLRISVKLETLKNFVQEQEAQLLADGAEQMNLTPEEFNDLVTAAAAGNKAAKTALNSRNAPRTAADIARAIQTLRARLQKRLDQQKKDAPVTFEELGVDGLLIDEAHLYKNLYFSTAKNNIAGLKPSDVDRAMDMYLKVRQINQQSKGRNVMFATGTPVSNAMSELYTMFRYLAQPQLERMGMAGFDSWANGNAEARAEMEPKPGGGYKERTRLRKWTNLRELSAQFRKFADVVTTDDLIKSGLLNLPTVKNGRPSVIALDPAPEMVAYMGELRDRTEALAGGKVDPKDDNHLKLTSDAALAAIDMRLVNPSLPADPKGRIATAAREIATRYRASMATQGAQIVFLDIGVPKPKTMPPLPASITGSAAPAATTVEAPEATPDEAADDLVDVEAEADAAMADVMAGAFDRDLYGDLRQLLVAQGIPDHEIAYVHQAVDEYSQRALYAAVNAGRVRVLIGSTMKGATGMNVQERLVALHHLDVPWRPADMEQREGRILRQGNTNKEIEILRYVTKESFDEYRWGVLATKQASISALMKGELTSYDDVDPAQLDYQIAQAVSSGDPRTLEMLNLDREVKGLQTRYSAFVSKLNRARRAVKAGLNLIDYYTDRREALAPVMAEVDTWAQQPTVTITAAPGRYGLMEQGQGATFDLKDTEARKALQATLERLAATDIYGSDGEPLGRAGPYTLTLNAGKTTTFTSEQRADGATTIVKQESKTRFVTVKLPVGAQALTIGSTPEWTKDDEAPDLRRSLDALLKPERVHAFDQDYARQITKTQEDVARQEEIAAKPFPQMDLLRKKEADLSDLRVELGIDQRAAPAAGEAPATETDADGAAPKSFDQPPLEPPADAPRELRRGNIQFAMDEAGRPRTTISLFARADLSSFLHETGHFFLEVFGDMADRVAARDPATRTPEQVRLLDDYDALLKEFKVENRGAIGTDEHEHFARQFERYLMEGQAPSEELRSVFSRFRAWLLGVYRHLRNIGTPLSPELHGIFDRMLASEAAIDAAERALPPLFTTPEQAGMSPARFEQYRTLVEAAHQKAREQLDVQMAKEVRRQQTELWQTQEAAMRADVTTEFAAQPVYAATFAIRDGTTPTGAPLIEGVSPVPMKLNVGLLVDQFGAERAAEVPDTLVTREGGSDPELIATLFGYASADAMLKEIAAAPPFDAAVKAETERRMLAEHGSMLTDGTLADQAQEATANEDRETLIRAEVKALWTNRDKAERAYERRWLEAEAKLRIAIAEGHQQVEIDRLTQDVSDLKATARGGAAAIRRAMPTPKQVRDLAAQRIAGTRIGDLKPAMFWNAARQAAQKAISLAARQDIAGATEAKRQELMNLAYHAAASRALADVDARREWVQRNDTKEARERTGKAGHDYLDQWDGMLDRYEFKRVSQKVLDRRARMSEWVKAQEAKGLTVLLPEEVLNDAVRINYRALTYEDFLGVTDGMKSLLHLARLKLKLLKARQRRSFEEQRDLLVGSIRARTPARTIPLEFPKPSLWQSIEDGVAAHKTLATFAFELDGHAYNGPFWDAIVRPANEAAAAEETRGQESATAYHALIERYYPGREVLSLGDKVHIDAINGSLSKEARLAIAMNWGNESSRARVRADPHLNWNERQIAAVLDTLDKRDWDFVQAHWDFLETFWPEIAAKSERLTGLAPEKVEAVPVVTPFGTYPGGYHPLLYDSRKSAAVGRQEIQSEAALEQAGAYLHRTTRRGHEVARKDDVQLPLRLDMTATTSHLQQVIHDLTHHEMLIDVTRLLRDRQVSTAILETQGHGVNGRLSRVFDDIATGDRANGKPTMAEKGATWLRTRAQIAGLSWNLWTALQQPLGIFNGMERVGVKHVAKAATVWARNALTLQKTVSMITDKSAMMRARYGTASQDLHDLRATLSVDGGWFDRLVRTVSNDYATQKTLTDSYMMFIAMGQRFADVPTWMGEYQKHVDAGLSDDDAVARADQAVLDAQGGGQIKDLAEVQRGGAVAKLFMTFASYGITVLNSTARAYEATNFKQPSEILRFLGHMGLLYTLPALLTEAMRCGLGRAHCDEVPQFLERVGGQSISTALNGMLYVREAAGAVNELLGQDVGPRGYAGPAGTRVFQTVTKLARELEQGELDEGLEEAILQTSGILLKYPAMQVQRTVDGFVALAEGRTMNPGVLLVGAPKANEATR